MPIEESARKKATNERERQTDRQRQREQKGGGGDPKRENETGTEKERIDTRASERVRRRRWMDRS
jgi:hypothetical protein